MPFSLFYFAVAAAVSAIFMRHTTSPPFGYGIHHYLGFF
jgi:hypothetical protein